MNKYVLVVMMFLLVGAKALANTTGSDGMLGGVGLLGSVIAIVASWSRNASVLWAILHGLLGWIYVIYFVLSPKKKD
ncbi:hypothetical protein ACPDHL_01805 [Myroides sp. C15-4]|uniref:hypothetical protein n=1 Tax=Myroides sp. C15-4 TaxID=3400532 RepID=UPI003D2F8C9F